MDLERYECIGVEIAHFNIIDARRFCCADQVGIVLAAHDGKHVERKVLDDPNRAFALIKIGWTQFARVTFAETSEFAEKLGDIINGWIDQNVDVFGSAHKTVQSNGYSANDDELDVSSGELCQQFFVRCIHHRLAA